MTLDQFVKYVAPQKLLFDVQFHIFIVILKLDWLTRAIIRLN